MKLIIPYRSFFLVNSQKLGYGRKLTINTKLLSRKNCESGFSVNRTHSCPVEKSRCV